MFLSLLHFYGMLHFSLITTKLIFGIFNQVRHRLDISDKEHEAL